MFIKNIDIVGGKTRFTADLVNGLISFPTYAVGLKCKKPDFVFASIYHLFGGLNKERVNGILFNFTKISATIEIANTEKKVLVSKGNDGYFHVYGGADPRSYRLVWLSRYGKEKAEYSRSRLLIRQWGSQEKTFERIMSDLEILDTGDIALIDKIEDIVSRAHQSIVLHKMREITRRKSAQIIFAFGEDSLFAQSLREFEIVNYEG